MTIQKVYTFFCLLVYFTLWTFLHDNCVLLSCMSKVFLVINKSVSKYHAAFELAHA